MSRSMALKQLWWKEWRQLFPLIGLLVLVGLFLQFMTLLIPGQIQWRQFTALLGMPALFAAGAGALLVGQEKESRTIDWLRMLPIAAGDFVRTKFLVAVVGLAIVWGVSGMLGLATGAWANVNDPHGRAFLWPLHSVFLLILGFATSWKLRSSMIALLVVVPLACLPLLFAGIHQSLLDWNANRSGLLGTDPPPWLLATYLVLFAAGFLFYGWRAGVAYFTAAAPPRSLGLSSQLVLPPQALSYSRVSPAPALLWQFAVQNRAALIGLALLQLFAILSLTFVGTSPTGILQPIGLFAELLTISWLGTLVFQSDTLQRRAMFLADRGVSPALFWITRQLLPLSSAILVALTMSLVVWFTDEVVFNSSMMVVLALMVLGVYLPTQWLGQVVSSPILAAIASPFVGAGLLAYFGYTIVELNAQIWTVAIAALIPLVATFVQTPAWMDRRTDGRFWITHAGSLAAVFLLPLTYFVFYTALKPAITADAKQQLQSLLQSNDDWIMRPYQLKQLPEGLVKNSRNELRVAMLQYVRQQLSENPGPIESSLIPQRLIADAMLVRMQDDAAGSPVMTQRYRDSIELLVQLHDRLRQSGRLRDQDNADIIEIWLVEELKAPHVSERLSSELIDDLVVIFSNAETRQDARRRAIAASWHRSHDGHLGGYELSNLQRDRGRVTTKDLWEASRKAGLVSELLLKSLDASGGELARLQSEIAKLLGQPRHPRADSDWDGAQATQLLYFETQPARVPGSFWNGSWEREGAQLAEKL